MKFLWFFLIWSLNLPLYQSKTRKAQVLSISYPNIQSASCQLRQVSSKGSQFYASLSSKMVKGSQNCGQCIRLKCTDPSRCQNELITAMVVNICDGCDADDVKLSPATLTSLMKEDINTLVNSNPLPIEWKFVQCPNSFVNGMVGACLGNGAGPSWVPLIPTNFRKPIGQVKINQKDTKLENSLLFAASFDTPQSENWYEKVEIEMISTDEEKLSFTLSFADNSSCSTSSTQFTASANAEGGLEEDETNSSSSSSSSSLLMPLVLAGIGVVALVLIALLFVSRHRKSHSSNDPLDPEIELNTLKPIPASQMNYQNFTTPRISVEYASPSRSIQNNQSSPVNISINQTKSTRPFQTSQSDSSNSSFVQFSTTSSYMPQESMVKSPENDQFSTVSSIVSENYDIISNNLLSPSFSTRDFTNYSPPNGPRQNREPSTASTAWLSPPGEQTAYPKPLVSGLTPALRESDEENFTGIVTSPKSYHHRLKSEGMPVTTPKRGSSIFSRIFTRTSSQRSINEPTTPPPLSFNSQGANY